MRKITSVLTLLLIALVAQATPISPSAAHQAAMSFMQAKGMMMKEEAVRAPLRSMGHEQASPYYVFNADKGFVVVSGDDCIEPILGYSTQGSFDATEVPEGMQWWMEEMGRQIALLSSMGVKAKTVALHEPIEAMLTTKWNQQAPYNLLCPQYDGKYSMTGCMATALAQVLNFHRWPEDVMAGPLPAYTSVDGSTMPELPAMKFDWDNMADDYTQETTLEQQAAVALLMRYCGHSLQMGYTTSGSNGTYFDVDKLITLFNYDQGLRAVYSTGYSLADWDELIYNELSERRPVTYGAFSASTGHSFVLDGYKVENGTPLYHVNWGWGGSSDGYYRLALLNANSSGSSEGSIKSCYNMKQMALIGLQPAKAPIANYGRYLLGANWYKSPNNTKAHFSVVNSSYKPGTFSIALAEIDSNGQVDMSHPLAEKTLTVPGLALNSRAHIMDFDIEADYANILAPGHHKLAVINREEGTSAEWRLLFSTHCFIEVVVSEDKEVTKLLIHPCISFSAENLSLTGLLQAGTIQELKFTLTNHGDDDDINLLRCALCKIENGILQAPVSTTLIGYMIEGNSSVEMAANITFPVIGDYAILLQAIYMNEADDTWNKTLEQKMQEKGNMAYLLTSIGELTFSCESMVYGEGMTPDGITRGLLNCKINNATSQDYNAYLLVKIHRQNAEGGYDPAVITTNPMGFDATIMTVNAHETKTINAILGSTLEPGNYQAELLMANDFLSNLPTDYFTFTQMEFTVKEKPTAIRNINSWLPNENEVYDMQGRRMMPNNLKKGIYVTNGRKFVVK